MTLAPEQEQDPILVPCWVQAQAGKNGFMVRKDLLCHNDLVNGQSVRQLCGSCVTKVTQVGTTARLMLGTDRSSSKLKCNLNCSMAHWVYAVVLLCILCVVLIVGVAACFMINVRDVMFGNVLTLIPVVSSCLSFSQRSSSSRQAELMTQLQSEPRQERRQLIDEIADQFDNRPERCDAVVRQI